MFSTVTLIDSHDHVHFCGLITTVKDKYTLECVDVGDRIRIQLQHHDILNIQEVEVFGRKRDMRIVWRFGSDSDSEVKGYDLRIAKGRGTNIVQANHITGNSVSSVYIKEYCPP